MQVYWSNGIGGFWLGSVLLGIVLILIGLLLLVWPQLLAYVVATVFLMAGMSMVGAGWRMRSRVTYRRLDGLEEGEL